MKTSQHTPQSVIADEIWNESDLWDLDDCGMEAASKIIARLERHGFVIVPKPSDVP